MLGGENVELTQRLTIGRRPGSSVYNNQEWNSPDAFYEFRQFNANVEQIKVMVDQADALYDGTGPDTKIAIWNKLTGAGQSFMQSVGNSLYWGDGVSQKKWLTTLQSRIPYVHSSTLQNPYNFTPFELDTFIIDTNGDAEQLIGTVIQLSSFYLLNNVIVFSLAATNNGFTLPKAYEFLQPGLEVYFPSTSEVAQDLQQTNGFTLTIQNLSGGITSADVFFGGYGYTVGDIVNLNQVTPGGSIGGQAQVTTVGSATGTGYFTASAVQTTTSGGGTGATLNITATGGALTGGTVASGGTNYSVGDVVIPTQPGATGGYYEITAVTSSGTITGLTIATGVVTSVIVLVPGMGYVQAENVPVTGGTGSLLTLNITDDQTQFSADFNYSGGPITSFTLVDRGTGYYVGDTITPIEYSQPSAEGALLTVSGVQGEVQTISLDYGGPTVVAYTTGATTNTTSGTGVGATFTISSVSGGLVTGVTVATPGSGYAVNDLIYLTQGSATGAILVVATLTGSGVATVTISQGGLTGYTVASGVATTTSGAGTGATINITTVSSGVITGATLGAVGTGYAIGDFLYVTQGAATGAYFTITSIAGSVVTSLSPIPFITYSGYPINVTMPTTGGFGTGLTVQLQRVAIPPTFTHYQYFVVPINGGNGYRVGDDIFPTYAGSSGTLNVTVTSVSPTAGPIASLTITDGGSGYVNGTDLPTTTDGSGTGATITIVVSNTDFFPPTAITDIVSVFSGGDPISDSRTNAQVVWGAVGQTTIDGSALWINRGTSIDSGLVYNWGIPGSTLAPQVVVNGATGDWQPNTYYNQWQFIVVTVSGSKYVQQLLTSGKSGASAPAWSTTPGQNTTDGTAVWTCLDNDGDTTMSWVASSDYSVGHILEETVSSVSCVFQLQPYAGILTTGSSFPVYGWQCNNQNGSDVGSAGELPNPSGGNMPMSQNGGQPTSTATWSGTANSLFLSAQGAGNPIETVVIDGDGTFSSSGTQLFPGSANLSIAMLPEFVVPEAGVYTFQIASQVSTFFGVGAGVFTIPIARVGVRNGTLTITSSEVLSSVLSSGVSLTVSGLGVATWLNGQTVTVSTVSGKTFTATTTHANYGPVADTGIASSGASLLPTPVSGPMQWNPYTSPNTYNFSTGTPIKGYPIMGAYYAPTGGQLYINTYQVSFPSAGTYPVEIQYGVWYHSTGSYVAPTTSPTYTGPTVSFYMVYQKPGGGAYYNIIPEGIATSGSGSAPAFPAWPTSIAALQAVPPPAYPSVTEDSGNYVWNNIGPTSQFQWTAATNYTTNVFIIDPNGDEEVPYEPGISGTTEPTFSTTQYGLTADIATSGSTGLVWMNNGPEGITPAGEISTSQGGWSYTIALVNTLDDTVSNASPVSAFTGNFVDATGVFISGGLPAVIDPQVDYVAIFRTDDGGATYYLIPPPASGNGNTEYTVPLATYLAQGFIDTTPDSGLNTLLEAPLALQNSIPPEGLINPAYNLSRIFGSVGNTVYWSTGPDTPIGNGINGFAPNNFVEFPSLVKRLIPLNIGMVVMTVSDIYLLIGNGTTGDPITPVPFLQRVGLLNYNALTVNGSIIYFMTTDQQVLELNVHSGVSQIGFPLADQFVQAPWSPATSYLTWHVNGSNDQCLFVSDGSTGWFRMSPTAAPESGLTWSPKANIVGGCKAVQSVETSPGNIQLLVGPTGLGPILYRDYSVSSDDGATYPANFILGSLVLAHPGQIADVEFITTDCTRFKSSSPINLGILLGEISGEFENLMFWDTDPPQLPPSSTTIAQRFYVSQTKEPAEARHCQVYVNFGNENLPSEILSLSVYGGFSNEG